MGDTYDCDGIRGGASRWWRWARIGWLQAAVVLIAIASPKEVAPELNDPRRAARLWQTPGGATLLFGDSSALLALRTDSGGRFRYDTPSCVGSPTEWTRQVPPRLRLAVQLPRRFWRWIVLIVLLVVPAIVGMR